MDKEKEKIEPTDFFFGDAPLGSFEGYTCVGGRKEDQDSYAYSEQEHHLIFLVCDGMGGHAGGCVASRTAAETAISSLSRKADNIAVTDAIVNAVSEANNAVYKKAQDEPSLRGMGTTLTLLYVDKTAAYVTHVGDSRIYQLRRGKKVFRTFDDSMVFEQVKKRKLTEEEARVHPRSNVLSRAVGVLPDIDVKVQKLPYRADDRFILCCDGVWNMQPESDTLRMFSAEGGLKNMVHATHDKIEELGKEDGGHHDNHTMIAVDLKSSSKYKRSLIGRIRTAFQHNDN